jgi:hypothetical protein
MTTKPLTTAELDTLAALIHSSGHTMITARDRRGDLALDHRAMNAIYTEAVAGFYDIQLRAPGGLTREITSL